MMNLAKSFWNDVIREAEVKLKKHRKSRGPIHDKRLTRGLLSRCHFYGLRRGQTKGQQDHMSCTCRRRPNRDPFSHSQNPNLPYDAPILSGTQSAVVQRPPRIFQLGYDEQRLIYDHLDVKDVESLVRSHWSVMEWVYDILLIFTPYGPVRNEKYESLLWYCNRVSQILRSTADDLPIDCDASDYEDTPAVPIVGNTNTYILSEQTQADMPVRFLTVSAYCREREPPRRNQNKYPAPNSPYLVKFKSHEHDIPPLMKGREVVPNAAHALKPLCSLMGRSLTLLWKLAVDVLKPREIIAMNSLSL